MKSLYLIKRKFQYEKEYVYDKGLLIAEHTYEIDDNEKVPMLFSKNELELFFKFKKKENFDVVKISNIEKFKKQNINIFVFADNEEYLLLNEKELINLEADYSFSHYVYQKEQDKTKKNEIEFFFRDGIKYIETIDSYVRKRDGNYITFKNSFLKDLSKDTINSLEEKSIINIIEALKNPNIIDFLYKKNKDVLPDVENILQKIIKEKINKNHLAKQSLINDFNKSLSF